MAHGLFQRRIHSSHIERDKNDRCKNDGQICLYLRHTDRQFEFLSYQIKIELEVDTACDHEKCGNILQNRRIPHIADILDRKSSGTHGSERMAHSLKERHTEDPEKQHLRDCDSQINAIENDRTVTDLRYEFTDDRPRALCLHKVKGRASQKRHNSEHEDKYTHASNPVRKASPDQRTVVQRLHFR